MSSNSIAMLLTTQLRPNAMAASRMALPSVVPATVVSPAPMPSLAPVTMTKVTIGPGVTTRTTVMRKKAANSSQFMTPTASAFRLSAVLVAFFADPLDRDDALTFRGVEHDHALGRASGDADAFHARADELAAVGDEHELILLLDRERSDHSAGLAGHRHGDDAFAAATGGAVLVRRGALAVAALGHREHELLRRRHLHIPLLAELDGAGRVLSVGRRLLRLAVDPAPHRARPLEIGRALFGGRIHVPQDRHRDHPVAFGERNAAHTIRVAAFEDAHLVHLEPDTLPPIGGEQHIVVFGAGLHVDN